jgi:2,4-dienoyl-CoA reductase-like NADH-dependent reductase (Old Yellow Enzyme family)
MPHLFEPLKLREVTFRNRIGISPMCQYSSENGLANDWHLVHLGARAVGGAGVVFTEAAAVEARGRISPQDLGIWSDEHIEPLARITRFIAQHGAVPGIQLAHAGRKASTRRPWEGGGPVPESDGGWRAVGASPIAFDKLPAPAELSIEQIKQVQQAFVAATKRSLAAGLSR